ncbi:cupin-like domain-containing protein [Gemmata sp. JC717]|uniref:cupin-like domain-containing protein n=1 Tax=Gemmata algarum TaxID=2975278 RepID=UPI0021BABBC6|nr:cupin-like domain-containing protein [Gemmata algarum]MDY3551940.1 cupin-like domain-containing protein [Gemmata algarum]
MQTLATEPRLRRGASVRGPEFRFVPEVRAADLARAGGFGRRSGPVLVKGAVTAWPAWERWSFESLAGLRKPDGSEAVARFITGVVEQGATREQFDAPVGPYLRDLSRAAERFAGDRPAGGLLPARRRAEVAPGDGFHLDWGHLGTFEPDRVYLSQWEILREFPELRRDFAIRDLWPGRRLTWEYVFVGPANTVTGFHFDFPDNWFCQVRGTKEVLLVTPEQSHLMCPSRKFDWGATLSAIDITRPGAQPEWASFERVNGLYARVEAGDALFIPKGTWHAVVALEPSVSLAVFGLTPWEVAWNGGRAELKRLLHNLGLYRRGDCACHRAR